MPLEVPGGGDDEFNPYAAPRSSQRGDEPTEFYRVDNLRVTYREYARLAGRPILFTILIVLKTLRIPVRWALPNAIQNADRLDVVGPTEVPAHVHCRWSDAIAACQSQGLQPRFFYRVPVIGATRESYVAVLRTQDGKLGVAFLYSRTKYRSCVPAPLTFSASSLLDDGRNATTVVQQVLLDHPPSSIVQRVRGGSVARLIQRHHRWIEAQGWTAVAIPLDSLATWVLERERSFLDYHIRRGTLVPLTEREYERMRQSRGEAVPPPMRDSRLTRNLWRFGAVVGILISVLIVVFIIWPRRFESIPTISILVAWLVVRIVAESVRCFVGWRPPPG